MAGPPMMPRSSRMWPSELGVAAVQWACGRRGRMVVISAIFLLVLLGLAGARQSETISSKYHAISSNYHLSSWRPHLSHLPPILKSPLIPSNLTLELEKGKLKSIPSQLNKATPNFHLLMLSPDDGPEFCKSTLSAMMLNYPPPTVLGLYEKDKSVADRELAKLKSSLNYLNNRKLVKENDLLLIVDGRDTWFQLPSEVIIRQFQNVLEDANKRLAGQYGEGKFNQTILFGASKTCEGEELVCKYVPSSILPQNIYGKESIDKKERAPAKYLDSSMIIGPAKHLRSLYQAAILAMGQKKSQSPTVQSVMATLFAEQQMARKRQQIKLLSGASEFFDYFGAAAAGILSTKKERVINLTLQEERTYEFSMGLDYTHTLFQPFSHCAEDELVPLPHDNSTDLSKYHHAGAPTPILSIPTALQQAKPPFWISDLVHHNPSPNEKPAYIDKLEFNRSLDQLKPRNTPWSKLKLIRNTYTGAIPAAFHVNHDQSPDSVIQLPSLITEPRPDQVPSANLTWSSLWYHGYERALLRKYFRAPQSPIGYHTAAVGGDRFWDQRGGRGGVWTEWDALWLPFGEIDGVCGRFRQITEVFGDGKGVWLHEDEHDRGKAERMKQEAHFRKKIEDSLKTPEQKAQEARERADKARKEKEAKFRKEREKKEKELKAKLENMSDEDKAKLQEQREKATQWKAEKEAKQMEKIERLKEDARIAPKAEQPEPGKAETETRGSDNAVGTSVGHDDKQDKPKKKDEANVETDVKLALSDKVDTDGKSEKGGRLEDVPKEKKNDSLEGEKDNKSEEHTLSNKRRRRQVA